MTMTVTLTSPGYWTEFGDAASVDWCEPNYTHGPWVAEWWNTLSSLPLVFLGLYGLWHSVRLRRQLEPRFAVLFAALAVVGAGSVAFHGTMLKVAQAADELPMIYGGLVFLYCLVTRRPSPAAEPGVRDRAWAIALTTYGVLFTVGYFALKKYFILFIWSYAGIVTILVLGAARVARAPEATPTHKRLVIWAAGSFVGGVFGLWFPEHVLLGCQHPAQALQLHAGWHLAAGLGTYLGILFVMWDRLTLAGQAPVLRVGLPAPFVSPGKG